MYKKTSRVLEVVAVAMIGEGIMGMIFPRAYSRLWKVGPRFLRTLMAEAAENPLWMRAFCAAEAGLGFWLAASQLDLDSSEISNSHANEEIHAINDRN